MSSALSDRRRDPDKLLHQVAEAEERERRGKLTIFFGAAPGVGKTYAMLGEARAAAMQGSRDVVVGVAETHGRHETATLLEGLESLPKIKYAYRRAEVEEFDLDAALARRPELLLVDELAHTNAEGARHPKRWQDVAELLDAGIDVYSTMNVQHIESLNDVIAKITGVVVRETVPDSMIAAAHEIKLIDLPPDELIERLRSGKVYVPAQAQRAIEHFFRKGNLIALRELALRQTAEHVDAQMQAFRETQGIEQTWAIAEQIIVAVSPSPYSPSLIRAARRISGALHARWFAVHVETPSARPPSVEERARLAQNLRLAQQLGAEVVTLSGDNATDELLRFAREHNVSKVVVGKPRTHRLRDRLRTSPVDEIVRKGGDLEVYVTAGDPDTSTVAHPHARRSTFGVGGIVVAIAVTGLCTMAGLVLFGRAQLPEVVLLYILGVILVANRCDLGASIAAAVLSVAAYNFFFIPPFFTFAVADPRNLMTFAALFLVAIVISGLTQRVRHQVEMARRREGETRALYELIRELSGAQGFEHVVSVGARHFERRFRSSISVFVPDPSGEPRRVYVSVGKAPGSSGRESGVVRWVLSNQHEAGLGTDTLPGYATLYVPLVAAGRVLGVLGLSPEDTRSFDDLKRRQQLDAFAIQLALAMERADLAEATDRARREVEAEQLRSSLLSSVSHDLRTPLAVIKGAASTLVEGDGPRDDETRSDLAETILEEADRLNRLIRNLLEMTRLESGAVVAKKEWLPVEEVIGSALNRADGQLGEREVRLEIHANLPLVPCDPVLVEQALFNLLENAVKYGRSPILVRAALAEDRSQDELTIEVADRGAGLPQGEEDRVFDKFHRALRDGAPAGAGLGLAICRAIVTAHGGRIWASNRPGGGASFSFTLPIQGPPPPLALPGGVEQAPEPRP